MTEPKLPAAAPAPAPAAPVTPAAAAPAPAVAPAAPAPAPAGETLIFTAKAKEEGLAESAPAAVAPKADPPEAKVAQDAVAAWQKANEEVAQADAASKEAKQKTADELKAKAKSAVEAWEKVDAEPAGKAKSAFDPAPAAPTYEELRKAGLELSDEHFKELDDFATEKKLEPAQVNALRLHQSELQKKATAEWQELQKTWLKEIQVDPEFGGDRFNESSEGVKRLLDKYGSPELKKILDRGMGNNPEFLRMMMRAYWSGMASDTYVRPQAGEPKPGPKSRAEQDAELFPTMHRQLSGEA